MEPMSPSLTKQKLTAVLSKNFPDASIKVEQAGSNKKLGGMVVWNGFDGIDQVDRQRELWSVLKKTLSPEEQLKISAILTMAPVETLAG